MLETTRKIDAKSRFGTSPEVTLRARLATIERCIAGACADAGRARSSVRLLPITKTVPAEILRHAYAAGLRDFAQNKGQQAQGKIDVLKDLPVRWTMVGHQQKNKAKQMLGCIQNMPEVDQGTL